MQAREPIESQAMNPAIWRLSERHGRLVSRRIEDLRPHPSLVRHNLAVPVCEFSTAVMQDGIGFRQPVVITQGGTILDGYAQWELARHRAIETLACMEYDLGEEEALQWLLQSHRRSRGLNDFGRILLALDLEPWLQEKARSNQQAGGQKKGSSNLTEAHLDVRAEIAAAAGVSTGNVTKVKQIVVTAPAEVLQALRLGEISIHRAWLWSKESPLKQRDAWRRDQGEKGLRKKIRKLVLQHRPETPPPSIGLGELVCSLQTLESAEPASVTVAVIPAPGLGIFVTEELFRLFKSQKEMPFVCATNNH